MINSNYSLMPKVMLITNKLDLNPIGGREQLCKLNHDALMKLYGENLVLFELPKHPLKGISSLLSAFKGHIDGLDHNLISKGLLTICRENVVKVIIDGSNLGGFAKAVKEKLPHVEVCTFFHNVEARFFLGSFRQQKSLHALAVLTVNYLAEKKSVIYSDKIICLSKRDSGLLQKVYGRGATHISPIALHDKTTPPKTCQHDNLHKEKFALFVGGVFYANHEGITWFIRNVVPRLNIKIYVVGRGFEAYRAELECKGKGKVQVIGAVDDLEDWYRAAHFVIAPIFDGSGMKTKVAEALMYGKKIIGTPEAFSGYEDVMNRVGWCCTVADDFVMAISCAETEVSQAFYPKLRALFEETYSFTAAVSRFEAVLGDVS